MTALCLLVPATAHAAQWAQTIPGSVTTTRRVVALTFDDGPSPYTAPILTVLASYRAHATFFEIGEQVGPFASTVRSIVRAGDEIGNHTYTHADLLYLSNAAAETQIQETQTAIFHAAAVTPRWFRPPGGFVDARIIQLASSLGLHSTLWSVDPRDWSLPGTGAIVQNVLANTRPGSVILLHDGGGNRSQTLAALPIILHTLRAEGYGFVTVSELFNLPAEPGSVPVLPSGCREDRAHRVFGAAGIRPVPTHAIDRAWLRRYCSGTNLGPATSGEYSLRPGVTAQDFARTAHRIQWTRATGAIKVRLMWSWASRVFAARGVQPLWHTPITGAWFEGYFEFRSWGAALAPPAPRRGREVQCFEHGCAAARGTVVTWRPRHRPG